MPLERVWLGDGHYRYGPVARRPRDWRIILDWRGGLLRVAANRREPCTVYICGQWARGRLLCARGPMGYYLVIASMYRSNGRTGRSWGLPLAILEGEAAVLGGPVPPEPAWAMRHAILERGGAAAGPYYYLEAETREALLGLAEEVILEAHTGADGWAPSDALAAIEALRRGNTPPTSGALEAGVMAR